MAWSTRHPCILKTFNVDFFMRIHHSIRLVAAFHDRMCRLNTTTVFSGCPMADVKDRKMINEPGIQPPAGDYQTGGLKAHLILIVCTLLYMLNYMDRVVITVVLEPIKLEMGLNDTQLGAIQMIYLLCHGLFALPVAYIIDRWSRRKLIGIMSLLWSSFLAFMGIAWNFTTVLVTRAFAGIGATALATGSISLITAAYPRQKHGWAMGIYHIGIPLGIALGAVIGGLMAARLGWRSPFLLLAGIGFILAVATFFLKDYKSVNESIAPGFWGLGQSIKNLLKIPTLRWFLPGYGLLLITSLSQINWLPTYLIRQYAIGTDTAGLITCGVSLIAVIGAPLGGLLSDIWYRKDRRARLWLPAVASVLSSLSLAASFLAFSFNFYLGLVLSFVFGIVNMIAIPVLSIVSQDVVPPAHKGLAYGLTVFSMYLLGGAWSPIVVGSISDSMGGGARGLMWAVIIACAGGLLAGIFFTAGSRHYAADEDNVKGAMLKAEG